MVIVNFHLPRGRNSSFRVFAKSTTQMQAVIVMNLLPNKRGIYPYLSKDDWDLLLGGTPQSSIRGLVGAPLRGPIPYPLICHFWQKGYPFPIFPLSYAEFKTWGPFLESPGNFTGPKSNIQIEIQMKARVLVSKLLHFVSLTDSFIVLDTKLLEPRSLM